MVRYEDAVGGLGRFTTRVLFTGDQADAVRLYAGERGLSLAAAVRGLALAELGRLERLKQDQRLHHKKMLDQQLGRG